jgi:hypothetical protein
MYTCRRCKKECFEKFGSGQFCSRQCANARERTEETKKKISSGVRNCDAYLKGRINSRKGKTKFKIVEKTCPICNSKFSTKETKNSKKFCSLSCSTKNPAMGGYRLGSGRSKPGWYQGFYCGSTWELAFLVWALEHDLPVQRCTEKFPYVFEGKTRTYLPDFKINDIFVEIKGYHSSQTEAKTSQFPGRLIVLYESDLQHVFSYVESKYGKNFDSLYEGNPHNKRLKSCVLCGNPCVNIYCSKLCSIRGNHKHRLVTHVGADPTPSG